MMHKITAVKVIRNIEYQEWQVCTYVDGKRYPDADYFTDDRRDAISTARCMLGVPQSNGTFPLRKIVTLKEVL